MDLNGSFFLLIQAVQDVHQGRLSCAVFAKKAVDGSLPQGKIHSVVGFHTAEYLGDALHFDSQLLHGVASSFQDQKIGEGAVHLTADCARGYKRIKPQEAQSRPGPAWRRRPQ